MSSATTDSDSSQTECPPAKRSLVIEPSSIVPITRQQHYLKSKIQKIHFYHRWTIQNFSYYCLSENGASNKHPCLNSSKFSSPSNDKLQFRLKLFTNGTDENSENNVSLYLHFDNYDKSDRNEMFFRVQFGILESDGKSESMFSRAKFVSGTNCGFPKFCTIERILKRKLTPGDVLTILCEIRYDDTVEKDSFNNLIRLDNIASTQLEKDCLELSKNAELRDLVLVFGAGEQAKEFAVHSAIVSARSEVFAAMFEHDMKEKNKRRVEITDVDAEVGEVLVKHLYGDYISFDYYAEMLLPIADKYQLHSLKSICEGALCFRINPESVGNLLLLADMHQADMLKSKCIDYIHCHSISVVESESFQNMKEPIKSRPELYYELFKQIPQNTGLTWSPPTLTCDPYTSSWSYRCSNVWQFIKLLTIENFDEGHLSVRKDPHDFIETSSFSLPNSSEKSPVQFSVKLHSQGENDDCKEYLSLHLQLKFDKMMKLAVKVKASIMVRKNSAKAYTQEISKKLSNGESIGWSKFITREQLMENKNLLLNGDKDQLVLLFEVFYISNIDKPVTKSGVNTFADEHKFSIARDLSQFYSNQKLTDIVFEIGNKKLHAHKSIVSARSSVFSQMFKRKSRVQIKDVEDVEAFSHVLALVYGQTDPLTHSAAKMLPLLDKFELNCLKLVCQIALCSQLSDMNVADFLLLADKHEAALLKEKAFEYIRRKHSVLTQNESLKVIQQQSPKLFHELLCYKLDNWKNLSDK